jgi:hypothetical protein
VGSKVAFVAKFIGRTIAYTYDIIVYTLGARLVMQTSEGPFPMETSEWRDGSNGGTLMTLRNRGEPVGFSRFVASFYGPAIRSANRKDLARLSKFWKRIKLPPLKRTIPLTYRSPAQGRTRSLTLSARRGALQVRPKIASRLTA